MTSAEWYVNTCDFYLSHALYFRETIDRQTGDNEDSLYQEANLKLRYIKTNESIGEEISVLWMLY